MTFLQNDCINTFCEMRVEGWERKVSGFRSRVSGFGCEVSGLELGVWSLHPGAPPGVGLMVNRGTSLIRNGNPLGPYSMTMPKALR